MKRWRKFLSLALAAVLVLSLASGAWAVPKGGSPGLVKGHAEQNAWQENENNGTGNGEVAAEVEDLNHHKEKEWNRHKEREKHASVKEHVYKGINNALEHVKNPVARAALEAILKGESVPEAVYQAKQSLKDWHDLVEVALVVEKLKEALEEDESIDKLTRAECYKYLGEMLVKAGKMHDARSLLEQALENNPGDDENYIILNKVFAKVKDSKIKVYIEGTMPRFDVDPRVENGRVLVPLRVLAEALGATVDYKDKTISIQQGNSTVILVVGNKKALVGGRAVVLEVPARVVDGRTLVPLRFIGEGLKAKVNYYQEGKVVSIEEA